MYTFLSGLARGFFQMPFGVKGRPRKVLGTEELPNEG
jgi:hypothetical protein